MFRIYCDGHHVENAFSHEEVLDAVAYWTLRGTVTVRAADQQLELR